ncbi:MAG: 3-deoxy-manno-octulosonate cytidylyltransferase [Pyrinomonadaceae bacterium]
MVAIIPARYSSVRLPGKMLLEIAGKPLILHTLGQAAKARTVSRVIVATDDERVFRVVKDNGGDAVMTSTDHKSGSDRIAEVAQGLPEGSIIVNVQGDEPTISPGTIDAAVEAFTGGNASVNERAVGGEVHAAEGSLLNSRVSARSPDIATTCEPITSLYDELLNGNVVKVVVGEQGYALYFSRSPMPWPREASLRHGGDPHKAIEAEPELFSNFRKHTGLYVYRREYLLEFTKLPQSKLEKIEMLEQLRALENGAKIKVVEVNECSIGVDTPEDFERVKRLIEGNG